MVKTKKYGFLALFALVLLVVAWTVKQNTAEPVLNVDNTQISPESIQAPNSNELVSHPAMTEIGTIPNADSAQFNAQQSDSNKDKSIQSVEAISLQIDNQAMIADIEKDMQLTLPPEGDLSYMSPENETLQPINPIFPAVAPEDINAKLGQDADKNQKLGFPFEGKPETE
jgi:hypothetical protein